MFNFTPTSATEGVWTMEPNRMGSPQFGAAGFGNRSIVYTWSMEVHDGRLYAGTFDKDSGVYGTVYVDAGGDVDLAEQFLAAQGQNGVRLGADLWCFPAGNGQPFSLTREGAGNPLNTGFRNMVSTPKGLFLGSANGSNLLTDPFAPPDQPLKPGGWELIQLVPVAGESLGPITTLEVDNLNPSAGDLWFQVETTQVGCLLGQATPGGPGSVQLALYDDTHAGPVPGISLLVQGGGLLQWQADASKTFYLRVRGDATDVDLRLDNTQSCPALLVQTRSARDEAIAALVDESSREPSPEAMARAAADLFVPPAAERRTIAGPRSLVHAAIRWFAGE